MFYIYLQDILAVKEVLKDQTQMLKDMAENTNTIDKVLTENLELKSKVTSLQNTQPAVNYDAVLEDLRTQNVATLLEIKDATIRMKRGFESEKCHIEKHITLLHNEIIKLGTSLNDGKTDNLDQSKAEFIRTLNSSCVKSMLEVSHHVVSDSRSTRDYLTYINSTVGQMASGVAAILERVDTVIKEELYGSILESIDNRLTSLDGSLSSKLTDIQGQLTNDKDTQTNDIRTHLFWHDGYVFPRNKNTDTIRLANNTVEHYFSIGGRLEVFHDGKWGTVCDDSFDEDAARVACNMLAPNVFSVLHKTYGHGTGPIWLDDVICSGPEKSLWSCVHNVGNNDCGHQEDVGILCVWKT